MISLKLCRNTFSRLFVALALISSLVVPPGFCQETEDSQVFISGFNAYQQKDYAGAIAKMNEVLQKYPDTPLRDMALFWLSRAYFKSGNQQDAARFMSQFSKEYPDNPLRGTVEEELLAFTSRYERGEKLSSGPPAAAQPVQAAARDAKAEKERLAKELADKEQLARKLAEQERMTAAKAEEERFAAAKAEEARVAAASAAERARIATRKAEEDRAAKIEEDRKAAENEKARLIALKAEEERKAAIQAEQARSAALKAEEARLAAIKGEQERIAAARAEEERVASEKSRIAFLKAEEERKAATQAEQARIAALKAEEQRLAQEQVEERRLAQLKAEQERTAADKVEKEQQAAAAAESARLTAAQQKQERLAAEKAAASAEAARLAALRQEEERQVTAKVEEERQARQREADEKARLAKAALREKAIAQYQSVLENYPNSTAAVTAAAKLKELGVAVALPPRVAAVEPAPTEQPENAQVLRLEVAQFAGFEFNLLERLPAYEVGRRISLPFEIVNRGNGSDSFALESGFPAQFNAAFEAAAAPGQIITRTPSLAPGEAFRGAVSLTIPSSSIDGLRITHPVKAASLLMSEASQSRELNLIAAAPLLRAVLKADKTQALPGERITYRIAVLNVGSTAGQEVAFRVNFPPQLEPVDLAAGFRTESKGAVVLDDLRINSGESKEYALTFQLKEDSLAGQDLLARADLVNRQLNTSATFVSNIANVKAVHGVVVKAGSDRLSIIPGQTFTVPFVVTNTGNIRETFKLAPTVIGAVGANIFQDLNRDSIRQANEPIITELGSLEPREEVSVIMEITTARTAADGTEGTVQIALSPEGETTRVGVASTRLMFSRPVLQMAMAGQDGRLKPGEVASFDLSITNRGSNLAKIVELQSAWPEQLELVASDPASSSVNGGNIVWKFKELGAGEKRTIKVSFRIRFGTSVGTNIKVTNVLKYEDQLGNRY